MADAVEDRKAEADEGDVLVAGDVLAVGVADEQIDRFVLDPLVQQEHVGAGPWRTLTSGTGRPSTVAMRSSKRLPGVPVTT